MTLHAERPAWPRPAAVLFDMDGVLVDSREAWYAAVCAFAAEAGRPAPDRDRYVALFGQSIPDEARTLFDGLPPERLAAGYDRHLPRCLDRVRVEPGAREVLAALRGRGIPTAVVTNSPRALAVAILGAHRLEPDRLVAADDVPAPKPAPDMLLAAARLLGVEVRAAWMVGDSDYDLQAARAAGARFLGLRHGRPRIALLADLLDLL